MANYYTHVSFTICLLAEQMDWAIAKLCDADDDDRTPGVDCVKEAAPANYDLVMTADGMKSAGLLRTPGRLWVTDQESVDVCLLAERLQAIMRHFDIEGRGGFEYSEDCSKPRLGAYGGGACVITKDSIEPFHSSRWLRDRLSEDDKAEGGLAQSTD
jgi:hypothetical protein